MKKKRKRKEIDPYEDNYVHIETAEEAEELMRLIDKITEERRDHGYDSDKK